MAAQESKWLSVCVYSFPDGVLSEKFVVSSKKSLDRDRTQDASKTRQSSNGSTAKLLASESAIFANVICDAPVGG